MGEDAKASINVLFLKFLLVCREMLIRTSEEIMKVEFDHYSM